MNLNTPLSSLLGIGYTFSRRLERLGLLTVADLIYHFPFRYDDFSNVSNALDAQIGEKVTLKGEIWSIRNIFTRSRKVLTRAVFNDGTSPITLTWFNQSYLTKSIITGDKLQISGKLSKYKNKLSIIAPVWEKLDSLDSSPITPNTLHTGRIVPIYPETSDLSSKWLRNKISQILPQVKDELADPLPEIIKDGMLDLKEAIEKVHFPNTQEDIIRSRERLGFDELFYINLATLKVRNEWKEKPTVKKFQISNFKFQIREFIKSLPFKLTSAQSRVLEEILKDLQTGRPMNRLVQGEVGSGKTVVAAIVAYIAHLNKLKTLFMAPTEILAFQHFSTLERLLKPLGIEVGIYTGSRKFNKKVSNVTEATEVIKDKKTSVSSDTSGSSVTPQVIVGTHALISEKLTVEDVGLIIVDEQQRFGVEQRSYLRSKAKIPHFLTMTATPIPRTVALTLYGDLEMSVIDELPVGRIKIKTHVVPKKKREDAYRFIDKKVKEQGDQVYIITPLIDISETLVSAKAATYEFEKLKKEVFPDLRLGLLHGRLKSKEKEQVLNDFKDHKIDILVSTSVVEVGVDIPNASIILIENAEKFGLAQLHQLRGRVGRGVKESFALLFSGVEDPAVYSRLKNLEKIDNGLRLAELDLKIRGSGEIFGKAQSGRFELKIASFSDLTLIEKTRAAAQKILQEDSALAKYPFLKLKLQSFGNNIMPD